MEIREYQNADWHGVLRLLELTMKFHMSIANPKLFHHFSKKLLVNYQRMMTAKHRLGRGRLLVAINEGKVVGFIYGEVNKQDKEMAKHAHKSGTIKEIYIDETARNKGLASKLMAEMENYLLKSGCNLLRLSEVHTNNSVAQGLYSKLGYIPRHSEYAKLVK